MTRPPHYDRHGVRVLAGDCLEVLAELDECSVDAVVCDPPYGLAEHRPPAIATALTAWFNGDREHVPDGRGFMGRAWDGFVPPPAVWDECLRVLRPGGHLAAFAGSRTVDLMTLSIRLAGFEIRDSLVWLYGSGFPKSLDVSKAIDKRAEVNDETSRRIAAVGAVIRQHREAAGLSRQDVSERIVGTRTGACWNWEHQQLPSVELWPAIKALLEIPDRFDALIEGDRARFIEAEREVIGRHERTGKESGTYGAFVGDSDITAPATDAARRWQGWGTALKPAQEPIVLARKPLSGTVAGTVLAHGTGGLNVDSCRVATDDDLNGGAYAAGRSGRAMAPGGDARNVADLGKYQQPVGRWPANVLFTHAPECADDGCAPDCPVAELDTQSGELSSWMARTNYTVAPSNEIYGKFAAQPVGPQNQYGDSGGASRFFPVFRWEAKAPTSERPQVGGVSHPTVKPLDLMRWLVRLLCPPGGLVLDPFAGSGTTGHAARAEGMRALLIERDPDYLPLIVARLDARPRQAEAPQAAVADDEPFDLFDLLDEEAS